MIYIYTLLDDEGKAFYIGQSKNPNSRFITHKARSNKNNKGYDHNRKLYSYFAKQKNPTYEVVHECETRKEADRYEKRMIRDFDKKGIALCNVQSGGSKGFTIKEEHRPNFARNGMQGKKHSPETLAKMRESAKERVAKGIAVPTRKGKTFTEDAKRRIRETLEANNPVLYRATNVVTGVVREDTNQVRLSESIGITRSSFWRSKKTGKPINKRWLCEEVNKA